MHIFALTRSHCQGCQFPTGQVPEVNSCFVRALQDLSQQRGTRQPPAALVVPTRSDWGRAGAEHAVGPPGARTELTGRSSPRAERTAGRTRSTGPSLHRPRIQQDWGGFVPSRTGRGLFVSQCRFLPPFLYFRFLPAPQEPKEPAAPRGVSSLGRRGSALPAVLLGAAPEHRAGTKQGETLPFGSVPQGLTALGGLRRANHVTPRQAARHPTSPPPALPGWEWGLGTGRATHRGQPRGLNVPAVSRPGPPEGLEGVGSGNLSRGLSKGPAP